MTPEEHTFYLDEIAKSSIGKESLINSAKMMENNPPPEVLIEILTKEDTIDGQSLPTGTPFRVLKTRRNR